MKKKECSALRGIAIIFIMLHNYCHWLPFAVPENEFSYDLGKYIQFWELISWDTFIIQFFSFWGHLGVSVFVLLSGYGLVQKYDNTIINYKSFIIKHYKKLCLPMVLGFITYYVVLFIINYTNNKDILTIIPINRFIAQLTLIINFLPNPHRLVVPGPYWYFGLSMQLYLIYLFLIHNRSIKIITVITLCLLLFSLFLVNSPGILIWTKFNSIGWLLPFVYGIFIGRWSFNPSIYLTCSIVSISFLLIPLFSLSFYTWLIIPLLVAIMASHIITISPIVITNIFDAIGKQSLYLFVLHPITREITIHYNQNVNTYIGLTLYLLLTFALAWVIHRFTHLFKHRVPNHADRQ